jgi:GTPase SAR1 family protein
VSGIDEQLLVNGPPKVGKTTFIKSRAHRWLAEHPTGHLFVHDPNGDYAEFCATYDSTDAWRAAAARASADAPMPRGSAFSTDTPEPVTKLVRELGNRHNRQHRVTFPMFYVIDECALLDTSGSTHAGSLDLSVMARRRHLGVALCYNMQHPTLLTRAFYMMATEVIAFAQTDADAVRELEKRAGMPAGSLAHTLNAPPRQYWRIVKGVGFQ